MIIKTIHLMNLAKADTLSPIMRNHRPEAVGAWGIVRSSFQRIQTNTEKLVDTAAWPCSQFATFAAQAGNCRSFHRETKTW